MLSQRDLLKAQAKNKAPSFMQITAEQILREAMDRKPDSAGPSKVTIANEAELSEYRMTKRKEFEDQIRRQRNLIGTWIKYAKWEEGQSEFRRARSIFERALQVDYQNVSLWLKYIEMEISHKFIQHARTLYDRVTSLLPRVDQFWYKYAYMEERLENYAGARAIYEKWMTWKPTDDAWFQYAKFEERCGEIERSRAIYERYIEQVQSEQSFVRYCKFEERNREHDKARAGYETCVQLKDASELTQDIFLKYAKFEMRRHNKMNAIRVFKLGLEKLKNGPTKELYDAYVAYTKESGSKNEIELILLEKRRKHYETIISSPAPNASLLDACINRVRLEEESCEIDQAREVYERAIALNLPSSSSSKKAWKRYIYLWLFYAQFEESIAKDVYRARGVLETAIKLVKTQKIYFSKLYLALAKLELRHSDSPLNRFRRVLGSALEDTCGSKLSIARFWIETEIKLGFANQARTVAAKLIEACPSQVRNWVTFIDLELAFGETNRAIGLCEMALANERSLDAPELVYKKLIEIESSQPEHDFERVRDLFKELIGKSNSYKPLVAYANYEAESTGSTDRACAILEEALEVMAETNVGEDAKQQVRKRLDELVQEIRSDEEIDT